MKISLVDSTSDCAAHHADPYDDYDPIANEATMVSASATESNAFLLETLTVNHDNRVEPPTECFVYSLQKGANTTARLNVQLSQGFAQISILDND